jgi:hypothetical protein
MWKALWKKWTLDKPAVLGDWLWDVFVVQFAALLDRLTIRKAIALIPIVVLAVAYHHGIPLPPELMLVGDLLAYLDVVSVVLLLGMLSRATTILFVIKQTAARVAQFASSLMLVTRRLDFRRRREHASKGRKRLIGRTNDNDGEGIAIGGFGWAS